MSIIFDYEDIRSRMKGEDKPQPKVIEEVEEDDGRIIRTYIPVRFVDRIVLDDRDPSF